MKKSLLPFLLTLLTISVFAQPAYFGMAEKLLEQATLPEDQIAINRLQWLPKSHDFWINDNGNIFMYSADALLQKNQ